MFKTRDINDRGKEMKIHHDKLLKFIKDKFVKGMKRDEIMKLVVDNFTDEELKMSVM